MFDEPGQGAAVVGALALERALEHGALVVAPPVADIDTADRVASELQAGDGHTFAYTAHMDFVPTVG